MPVSAWAIHTIRVTGENGSLVHMFGIADMNDITSCTTDITSSANYSKHVMNMWHQNGTAVGTVVHLDCSRQVLR